MLSAAPPMRWPRNAALGAALLLLLAVPLLTGSAYHLNVLINAMVFTVLAMSLNVIYGYAGLLSFAQIGFWGLGAYTAALLALRLGWSPWIGMAAGAVLCAAVAVLVGAIALRLSNHAFVVVSIAFTLLLQMLAQEWISLTNGPMALPDLPHPGISVAGLGFTLDTPRRYYYFALAFGVLSLAVMRVVLTSRAGRTLRLVKHDEVLARSYGIRVTRWKLFAAGLAAAFAALAGSVSVFYVSIVDPLIFDIYYTQIMLVIVIVGGLGSFWPVVVAGFVITILPEILRTPNEIRMINYGIILIATIVFFPRGFAGLFERLGRFPSRKAFARRSEEAAHG